MADIQIPRTWIVLLLIYQNRSMEVKSGGVVPILSIAINVQGSWHQILVVSAVMLLPLDLLFCCVAINPSMLRQSLTPRRFNQDKYFGPTMNLFPPFTVVDFIIFLLFAGVIYTQFVLAWNCELCWLPHLAHNSKGKYPK